MRIRLLIAVVFAVPSVLSAQSGEYAEMNLTERLPVQAQCRTAADCRHVPGAGVVIQRGGVFQYQARNLNELSFRIAEGQGAVAAFTTDKATANCDDPNATFTRVAAYGGLPVSGAAWSHGTTGPVCLRWTVGTASPANLVLTRLYESTLLPEVVSASIATEAAERATAAQFEKLQAERQTQTTTALVNSLTGIRRDHEAAMRRTSFFYMAAANTEMALSLSQAVGAMNRSSNPTEYKQFNQIVGEMKTHMDSSGTQIRQLNRTIEQFEASQSAQPLAWLKGGLELVDGLLGSTPFGVAASGVRSLLANVYDRGQLALQHGGFALSIQAPEPVRTQLNTAVGSVRIPVSDFVRYIETTIADSVVNAAARDGVSYFTQMDSLLTALERTNAKVNQFNVRSENLRLVAIDNQRTVTANMVRLLELGGTECEVAANSRSQEVQETTRELGACDSYAWAVATAGPASQGLLDQINTYYSELRRRVESEAGSTQEKTAEVQGLAAEIRAILDEGESRHTVMSEAFEDLVKTIIDYLENGNPFKATTQSCLESATPEAQPSNYCSWRAITQGPLQNLKNAYRTTFGRVYRQ